MKLILSIKKFSVFHSSPFLQWLMYSSVRSLNFLAITCLAIAEQADILANDEDLCGYYFWPYDVIDYQSTIFGGMTLR